jgi:hypothetical protein
MQPTRQLPPMPEIGRPESYYAKLVHEPTAPATRTRTRRRKSAVRDAGARSGAELGTEAESIFSTR